VGQTSGAQEAQVIAYGSGNAAQVYFDLFPRRITLAELEAAYPGMVDAVVQHEGIGLVLGVVDDGSVVALGKHGRRNLNTGVVEGEDPILPYAPTSGHGAATVETRVWQLRRVMEFPNAGDLWLISTVYPDGTVAALEELVGNHGGVGGEQTDAFIFHPPQMEVTPTRNSTDVFHLLNRHRGAPVVAAPKSAAPVIQDWRPANLLAGLRRVGAWVGAAVRCLFLDRKAYAEVAADPYMTGPALLIAVIMIGAGLLVRDGALSLWAWLSAFAVWLLSLFVVTVASYLLTREVSYTRIFRAMAFSRVVNLYSLLALVPALRSLAALLLLVLGFLATWMGAVQATGVRGWRALLLPVLAYVVLIIGAVIVEMLLTGVGFSLNSVLDALGLSA
jgi:hypothetical protein